MFYRLLHDRLTWLSLMVLVGADLIPVILIWDSNTQVFPGTSSMANGMLAITMLAALVLFFTSNDPRADGWTKGIAIAGTLLLGGCLWWNMVGHWQLAREVDAASTSVHERREEETIQDRRAAERAKINLELARVQAEADEAARKLEAARANRIAQETRQYKLAGVRPRIQIAPPAPLQSSEAPSSIGVTPTPTPEPTPAPVIAAMMLNPEQVKASWMASLTKRAYFEAGFAMLFMILLAIFWHADFDGDGLSDRIQRLPREVVERYYPDLIPRLFPNGQPQPVSASLPSGLNVQAMAGHVPEPTPPAFKMGFAGPTPGATPAPTLYSVGQKPAPARVAKPTPTPAPQPTSDIRREGNHWIVLDREFPEIAGVRWKPDRGKGIVEAHVADPTDGRPSYLMGFRKRRLAELDAFDQSIRFETIRSQVGEAIERRQI